MNLKQLVEQLDAQVLSGDIIGAFKAFFADDAVTLSGPNDITHTKAQKIDALEWFFGRIARSNKVVLLSCGIGDDVTHSEFVFDFTDKHGNNLVWNEVIRRRWRDGKVINEKYYTAGYVEDFDKVAPAAPKKTTTTFSSTSGIVSGTVTGSTSTSNSTITVVAKKASNIPTESKKAETVASPITTLVEAPATKASAAPAPKKEKAVAAKKEAVKVSTAKPSPEAKKSEKAPAPAKAPVATKPDDLTLIEGIGPKINELLQNAGIKTFAQLAASAPADIKTILDAAGKRYQMHDPSTWPQQSALARDGKTAELAKLQDDLKGGKK